IMRQAAPAPRTASESIRRCAIFAQRRKPTEAAAPMAPAAAPRRFLSRRSRTFLYPHVDIRGAILARQRGACRRGRRALRPADRHMGTRCPGGRRGQRLAPPRPLAIEGHAHGDARALAEPAAYRQLAAVKPEQAFDDGETEAGAAVAAVVGRARLKVRFADPRQILAADADA